MSSHNRRQLQTVAVSFLAVLVSSFSTTIVRGQAPPPAIGSQVVIKAGAVLKVGDQVVDTGKAHHIYRVERADGPWLWLGAGTIGGWAQATDVIPFDQAIDLYTTEIYRNSNSIWAYYNRGIIRFDQRNYDQAISDYNEALRIDPRYVPALINRGNAWQAKKEFDKAIDDYNEALRIDPNDIRAHLNRGIARQAKKDYDNAIADYNDAIRLGLKTATVYNNRGHLWQLKQDLARAIADFDEAIRLNPKYGLAYNNRGNALQARKEYDKALANFDEAIRLSPESPWGFAQRAWILATCPDAKFRDGKKALDLAKKASDLGETRDPYLLEVRAAAHAEAGEFDRAVEWQTKALEAAAAVPGNDLQGDRLRLKLYQEKKPYRDEDPKPGGGAPGHAG